MEEDEGKENEKEEMKEGVEEKRIVHTKMEERKEKRKIRVTESK